MKATHGMSEWSRVAVHGTREQYLDDVSEQMNNQCAFRTVVAPTMFCFKQTAVDDPLCGRITARPALPGADTGLAVSGLGSFAAWIAADLLLLLWDNQWLQASLGMSGTAAPGIMSLIAGPLGIESTLHAFAPERLYGWQRQSVPKLEVPRAALRAISTWQDGYGDEPTVMRGAGYQVWLP